MDRQKVGFPLLWWEGIKRRGIEVTEITLYSPSPQPSPIKGEGVS